VTLFKWGSREADRPDAPAPADAAASDVVAVSKVLPRFLSAVERHPAPVVLDLGPVVGANVALFGERLACKLLVLDLCQELERPDLDEPGTLTAALVSRLPAEADSVDGILCWDVFDYLDESSSLAIAAGLAGVLRPGGVLHAFFSTVACRTDHYTRFVVEAQDLIRQKPYPATPRERRVLSPRDIDRMFDGLDMTENVLLKTRCRETLFRRR